MARPNDYGDQFPSDLNDQPPSDPTEGFQEIDYDPSAFQSKGRKPQTNRNFVPDSGQETPAPITRSALYGVLLANVTGLPDAKGVKRPDYPEIWQVLRQDGKIIEAFTTNTYKYEKRRAGDEVTLLRGTTDTEWTFVNRAHPREMQSIDVWNSAAARGNSTTFKVTLDKIKDQVPQTDIYSDKDPDHQKLKLKNGGVQVLEETTAWYEINFNATVQLEKAGSESVAPSTHVYQSGCWKPNDLVDATALGKWINTAKLYFHANSGFRLYWDPSDCTANVGIYSGLQDSILNQQYKETQSGLDRNQFACWTNAPKLGGSVYVGTQEAFGWVKIGRAAPNEDQAPFVWHTHSGWGKLRVKWPGEGPRNTNPNYTQSVAVGSVLSVRAGFVSDKFGDCIELGWTKPGINCKELQVQSCEIEKWEYCYIYTYCCEEDEQGNKTPVVLEGYEQTCARPVHKCLTLEIKDGMITKADCDEKRPAAPIAACGNSPPKFFDPCGHHS